MMEDSIQSKPLLSTGLIRLVAALTIKRIVALSVVMDPKSALLRTSHTLIAAFAVRILTHEATGCFHHS